jgi:hypothetical protein
VPLLEASGKPARRATGEDRYSKSGDQVLHR